MAVAEDGHTPHFENMPQDLARICSAASPHSKHFEPNFLWTNHFTKRKVRNMKMDVPQDRPSIIG
jgi:hypothetical protein